MRALVLSVLFACSERTTEQRPAPTVITPYCSQDSDCIPDPSRSEPKTCVVRTSPAKDTTTPFEVVHDPSHPDADSEGNVLFPNVNTTKEMAEMIVAMRAYEANLNAQETFVRMAERALRLAQ